jgi:hypothetical protein
MWEKHGSVVVQVDHKVREADSRGRISLGPEFADETVEVIVVEDERAAEQSDKQS